MDELDKSNMQQLSIGAVVGGCTMVGGGTVDQLELEQGEQIQYMLGQVDTLLEVESTADEVPRCERQTAESSIK